MVYEFATLDVKQVTVDVQDPAACAVLDVVCGIPACDRTPRNVRRALQAAGLLSGRHRGDAWYRYTHCGSCYALREPAAAAVLVLEALGVETPVATSWSTKWRRTKRSLEAEARGAQMIAKIITTLRRVD